jgi:hypothetical protein
MKKGTDAVAIDPAVFAADDGMTRLGVGKNMVRSIRHWCLAAEMIEEYQADLLTRSMVLRPSRLGLKILADNGWDPYLEDPATSWLLHWKIASNARKATTWYWAFSYFHEQEFTRDSLLSALHRWTETNGLKRIALSSLKRDVDCFLRTYVPSRSGTVLPEDSLDCPLVELRLIREAGDRQTFQFHRGLQPDLPDGVLFHAVVDYWERAANDAETFSLHDLTYQPGSPGRIFQIDEDSLATRLADMEEWTERRMTYGETAGLRQLYRRKRVDPLTLLSATYKPSRILAGGTADA